MSTVTRVWPFILKSTERYMQAAARNLPSRAFGQLHTYLLRDNRQAAGRILPSRAFGQLHTNLLQIKRREVDQNLLPIGGNYRGVGQWESKLFVRRMNFSSCRPTKHIITLKSLIIFQTRPQFHR